MKKNYFILLAMALIFYGTTWAQPTSYGNLNQGNAGDNGNVSNSYFGYEAGINNIGNYNTFSGYRSGVNNTTGHSNDFIGFESGHENIDGNYNAFIGRQSGYGNTSGGYNIFMGTQSGYNNTTGNSNTFIGHQSGHENISGGSNIFIGYRSGYNNTIGGASTFVGTYSGYNATTGIYNTFIGADSGTNTTTGNNNTFIGRRSGYNNQTGSGNVFLGHAVGAFETGSDLLYIDNSSTSLPLIWGDFANDALRFHGTVRITNIPQDDALTRVLVSDNDGNVNWRDVTSISDGTGTDDQQLNLVDNDLQLEDGGNVDLSSYLDNTDNQDLQLMGNTLSISGGNSVELTLSADNLGNHQVLQDLIPDTDNTYNLGGNGTAFSNIYFDNSLFINDTEFLHTRDNNVAIGPAALGIVAGGAENVAVGENTLAANTTGSQNTANGTNALNSNIIGNNNTGIGHNALYSNENGENNTAVGRLALVYNTSGFSNVAVGEGALLNSVSGSNNVAIGYRAMFNSETGDNNTAIGNNANTTANNLFNTTAIGNEAMVSANNQVRIGNANVTSIGGYDNWSNLSDGRFKKNIQEDIPGLEFITQLRPVSYELDRSKLYMFLTGKTSTNQERTEERIVGFIAQEVEKIITENQYSFSGVEKPQNERDHYGIKYAEFVVPLTKAVQELSTLVETLQQQNEAQQQKIEQLEAMVYGSGSSSSNSATGLKTETTTLPEGFGLKQNLPNPFDKTTSISALVPESVQQAKIIVYNLQGLELERYDIDKRGSVSVEISGGRFPSGMYLYALIADGQLVDTKKMILTK